MISHLIFLTGLMNIDFSLVRVMNIDFSPVICLEQPLSRYHDLCFSFALRHISTLTISDLGNHVCMGPLRLVLEVLLFFPRTLWCKLDSFWSLNTLGLTPFGFGSQEAATVFFFWNLDFKIPDFPCTFYNLSHLKGIHNTIHVSFL